MADTLACLKGWWVSLRRAADLTGDIDAWGASFPTASCGCTAPAVLSLTSTGGEWLTMPTFWGWWDKAKPIFSDHLTQYFLQVPGDWVRLHCRDLWCYRCWWSIVVGPAASSRTYKSSRSVSSVQLIGTLGAPQLVSQCAPLGGISVPPATLPTQERSPICTHVFECKVTSQDGLIAYGIQVATFAIFPICNCMEEITRLSQGITRLIINNNKSWQVTRPLRKPLLMSRGSYYKVVRFLTWHGWDMISHVTKHPHHRMIGRIFLLKGITWHG